jgi:hypothetical protein
MAGYVRPAISEELTHEYGGGLFTVVRGRRRGLLKYASNLCLYDLICFFIAFQCLTPLTITGTYAHRLRALLYICPAFFLVCSDLFLWL